MKENCENIFQQFGGGLRGLTDIICRKYLHP